MVTESEVDCPFCGETITILVDASQESQDYTEDCSVCCRPILFHVRCSDGEITELTADRSGV